MPALRQTSFISNVQLQSLVAYETSLNSFFSVAKNKSWTALLMKATFWWAFLHNHQLLFTFFLNVPCYNLSTVWKVTRHQLNFFFHPKVCFWFMWKVWEQRFFFLDVAFKRDILLQRYISARDISNIFHASLCYFPFNSKQVKKEMIKM
jgi:hypothetical protein